MSADFQNPSTNEALRGDYRLGHRVAESEHTVTWQAEQISVSRPVILEELRPTRTTWRDAFLADVRAKAAVDHPGIASVYEAVANETACYFTRERLPDPNLADGPPLKAEEIAALLRSVAEANAYLESRDHAAEPLDLQHIHRDPHCIARIDNLTLADARPTHQSEGDMARLGEQLPGKLLSDTPGATRLLALLGWMRGEGTPVRITWPEVASFAKEIEHQLAETKAKSTRSLATARASRRRKMLGFGAVALACGALAGTAIHVLRQRPAPPEAPARPVLPGPVTLEAGTHPSPDGEETNLPAFKIASHEVTIGEYAAFLEALERLTADGLQATFDDPEQPVEKTGHEPDDWTALHEAAKGNGTWSGMPVTLDSPVVGVDWWDAAAYSGWKNARLPTQEEWHAALCRQLDEPAGLTLGKWEPFDAGSPDRTPAGLHGMAGSVAEWTAGQSVNPANPLGPKQWVIIGGSYLKGDDGALTREWTPDRTLRRPDLGFRVVFPVE